MEVKSHLGNSLISLFLNPFGFHFQIALLLISLVSLLYLSCSLALITQLKVKQVKWQSYINPI